MLVVDIAQSCLRALSRDAEPDGPANPRSHRSRGNRDLERSLGQASTLGAEGLTARALAAVLLLDVVSSIASSCCCDRQML